MSFVFYSETIIISHTHNMYIHLHRDTHTRSHVYSLRPRAHTRLARRGLLGLSGFSDPGEIYRRAESGDGAESSAGKNKN